MIFSSSKTRRLAGAGFRYLGAIYLGVAAALMPQSVLAQEQGRGDPGSLEVRVFDSAGFSGAMRSLTLDERASYAYFERLGDDGLSSVRSLKAGASVGVVLFRHAFFVSRDQSCAPTLGSDENPDLIWTGATADFLPVTPGTSGVDEVSDAGEKGYASAILFRRAEGPPPGALLMKRRRSYGKGCGNILRSLNFDRRFVPMAFQTSLSDNDQIAPQMRGCVNLQGRKIEGGEGAVPVSLSDMLKSDRIALLQPSDLNRRYEKQDRGFRAVLFDSDNCQGGSVTLDAASASGRRDILLSDYLFRDRVRSLRVEASDRASGALAKASSPAPTPVQTPVVAGRSTPVETPKLARTSPVLASKAEAPRGEGQTKELPLDEAKPVPIEATAAPKASEDTKRQIGLPAAKLEPMTDLPAEPKASPTAPAAAPAITPPPSPLRPLQPSETSQAVAQAEAEPQSDPPAAAEPAAAGNQVFTFPVYDVYRLNYCLNTRGGCGEPAATKWCELKGFKRAVEWQKDNNIGGIFPTFIIGDRKICAQYKCDGFAEITCGN